MLFGSLDDWYILSDDAFYNPPTDAAYSIRDYWQVAPLENGPQLQQLQGARKQASLAWHRMAWRAAPKKQ